MERHGGGDDGEMMSSGDKGVVVCVEYSCFATVWLLCWIWWNMAVGFCLCFHFCLLFLVCKIGDRGAVVRLLVVF